MLKFLTQDQVETFPVHYTYRPSIRTLLLVFAGLLIVVIGLGLVGWRGGIAVNNIQLPGLVIYYVALVLGGYAWVIGRDLGARWGHQNWLLKLGPQGLLIKFRSYRNAHFSQADPVVLWLPYRDISGFQVGTASQLPSLASHSDKPWRSLPQNHVLLDLFLQASPEDLEALVHHVKAEVYRTPPWRKTWFGRTRVYYRHFPVRLMAPDHLRLDWDNSPQARQLITVLEQYLPRIP